MKVSLSVVTGKEARDIWPQRTGDEARAFIEFLKSDRGHQIFRSGVRNRPSATSTMALLAYLFPFEVNRPTFGLTSR